MKNDHNFILLYENKTNLASFWAPTKESASNIARSLIKNLIKANNISGAKKLLYRSHFKLRTIVK